MKYDILLFDADNTILDFDRAEEQALRLAFERYNLHFDDNVLSVYRKNNVRQWQLFERGIIKDKREVLTSRVVNTFAELGINADCMPVSESYEANLHNGFYVISGAERVLRQLRALDCRLYLVSNGVLSIQNSRMKGSGMDKYFIRRFVSEEVGCPKPQKAFFEYVFANIENFDKSRTLIIGDSLTSDIQGGINSNIDTCWYNPKHVSNPLQIKPTYEIDDLERLIEIIAG